MVILRIWFVTHIFIGHAYSYMLVLHTLICQSFILLYSVPTYFIFWSSILLYTSPLYSYMPVLHTLICPFYLFLYACPIYSYMPKRCSLIYQSYLFVYAGPIYSDMASYILLYAVLRSQEHNGLIYKRIQDWNIKICRTGI
jgi:hypothetical protein